MMINQAADAEKLVAFKKYGVYGVVYAVCDSMHRVLGLPMQPSDNTTHRHHQGGTAYAYCHAVTRACDVCG